MEQEVGRATFTPGPWRMMPAEAGKPYVRVRGSRLGERYKIANVLGGESALEQEEAEANARMIAESPNMLDALEAICAMLAGYDGQPNHLGDVFKIADGTRAKARGEGSPA